MSENQKVRTAIFTIAGALVIGTLADVLMRHSPWGLNLFLLVVALAAVFAFLRSRAGQLDGTSVTLLCGMVLFSALFCWRDSEELQVFDVFAILLLLSLMMLPSLKVRLSSAGLSHYVIAGAASWISAVFAPVLILFRDINPPAEGQSSAGKTVTALLRGVAVALPFLLVFGVLFTSADAEFEGIVDAVMNLAAVEFIIRHGFTIGFIAWLASGFLRNATRVFDTGRFTVASFDNSILPRTLTLGIVEISVLLGLVNLLFLLFVVLQLPYLFGGLELVQSTPDFKLSEYARRGFGELVAVAVIVIPMLLGSHWLLRRDDARAERLFRVLACLQIALLFLIMASAMHRLLLLTGSLGYGMTTQRFYPMVFIVWLAVVFVWFVATVLRGKRERFAIGVFVSALVVLAAVHVINPDRFIARTNIALMAEGRPFDGGYNGSLSVDAVPDLVAALPSMEFEAGCLVRSQLREKLWELESEDSVLSFNISRSAARNVLQTNRASFDTSMCPGCLPYCKRVD